MKAKFFLILNHYVVLVGQRKSLMRYPITYQAQLGVNDVFDLFPCPHAFSPGMPVKAIYGLVFHQAVGFPYLARYCSWLTSSIHSTLFPFKDSETAKCAIPDVALAPCQCLTCGGIHTTSPTLYS